MVMREEYTIIQKYPSMQDIILNCEGKTMTQISRLLEITYSHVTNVCKILEEQQIIGRKKVGRRKHVWLTTKGHRIRSLLMELRDVLKEGK